MSRLRRLLQRAKQRYIVRRESNLGPICIVAARRGGSTLLADAIASNRGVWFVDEPFAMLSPGRHDYERKVNHLPQRLHSQYFDLDAEEQHAVWRYVDALLRGTLRIGTCRFTKFALTSDRVLLKTLNAPFLSDWLEKEFGMRVVVLSRHPGAQALSILRNRWGFGVEAYLQRPEFLSRFLREDQISFAANLFNKGNPIEIAALDWVFLSAPLWRRDVEHPLTMTYEELVMLPQQCVDYLCRGLELRDPRRMIARLGRSSGSSRMSTDQTKSMIQHGDRIGLISRWTSQIDDADRRKIQSVLDVFEIDAYRMDSVLPAPALRLFPEQLENEIRLAQKATGQSVIPDNHHALVKSLPN